MDLQIYSELLAKYQPLVIETPDEHDHMLGIAETLMEKGDELSPEEEKLLAMVVLLIEAFEVSILQEEGEDAEEEESPAELPSPHATLQRLLIARELDINDVAHIFGNPYVAREAIEGKRPISRSQAKDLGKFFRTPAKLFHANA